VTDDHIIEHVAYIYQCPCGWMSDDYEDRRDARNAGAEHRIEEHEEDG